MAYFIQDGRDHVFVNHDLIGSGREGFVKVICLVAQGTGSHRQLNIFAFQTICRHDDTTIFLDFTVIASPTADHDVDVSVTVSFLFEVTFFTLQPASLSQRWGLRTRFAGCSRLAGRVAV